MLQFYLCCQEAAKAREGDKSLPWILFPSREASAETKPKAKIKTGNMVRDKTLDLQWEMSVKEADKDSHTEDRFLP